MEWRTTLSEEETQSPAVGNIWILENTMEQSSHLRTQTGGDGSWSVGYVMLHADS